MEFYHDLLALSKMKLSEIKLKLDNLLLNKTNDLHENLRIWSDFLDNEIYPLHTESFTTRYSGETACLDQRSKEQVDSYFNVKLQRLIFEYDKKILS